MVKEVVAMSKKAIIALTVSISATVVVMGAVAVGTVICKKIYEKNYFSANRTDVFC